MDLSQLRQERQQWLTWKNIVPLQEAIAALPKYEYVKVTYEDTVTRITSYNVCYTKLLREDRNMQTFGNAHQFKGNSTYLSDRSRSYNFV